LHKLLFYIFILKTKEIAWELIPFAALFAGEDISEGLFRVVCNHLSVNSLISDNIISYRRT